MPVMVQGHALREFAGATPSGSPDTKDPDEIVEMVVDRAGLRRHQPRGHLRPALFLEIEDRPEQLDIPSSTTTSTAPPSSSSRRCHRL
jgi:hypothetical protein